MAQPPNIVPLCCSCPLLAFSRQVGDTPLYIHLILNRALESITGPQASDLCLKGVRGTTKHKHGRENMSLDVTDAGNRWRITPRMVQNMKTNQLRAIERTPSATELSYMTENQFVKKCKIAFDTGQWPE